MKRILTTAAILAALAGAPAHAGILSAIASVWNAAFGTPAAPNHPSMRVTGRTERYYNSRTGKVETRTVYSTQPSSNSSCGRCGDGFAPNPNR